MLYDRWRAGWAGYSPADNPDSNQPLAHVRFGALDIDATPARVAALAAQGLVRPYSYEPWHWELPNIRIYPLVHSIPSSADSGASPFLPPAPQKKAKNSMSTLYIDESTTPPTFALAGDGEGEAAWLEFTDQALANDLAGFHGISQRAVKLGPVSFAEWRAKYLGSVPAAPAEDIDPPKA